MPPAASHPVSTDLSDQEVQARLTAAWVGIWMSVIVCLGAEVYALVTWNTGANRELLLLITTIGLVTSPMIASLPLERIIRSRYREVFFVIWTTADIALIAASAALDGGTQSPFVLVLVLPFLYGALSYPLWATAVAGVVSLTAFVLIAISAGRRLRLQRLRRVRPALRRDPRLLGVEEPVQPAAAADQVRQRAGPQRGGEPPRRRAAARGGPLRPAGPGGNADRETSRARSSRSCGEPSTLTSSR